METVGNFRQISENARTTSQQLSLDLRAIVKNSKGNIDTLTNKLFDILGRIDTTLDDANTVVKKLTEQVTDPRLQQSVQETVSLASATLARFNQIASDLDQLVGDPKLQSDLKQTATNVRNLTEESREAVQKVNALLDQITDKDGSVKKPSIRLPKVQFIGNLSEQIDPSKLRLDVDAHIFIKDKNYIDVGVYDLGQTNYLNLQYGMPVGSSLTARYGLYASKLGVGLDYNPQSLFGARADLWDTNQPKLDVRGLFRVNSDASIWVGLDNIFQGPSPVIGFQLKN